jgi:hypothetical protein
MKRIGAYFTTPTACVGVEMVSNGTASFMHAADDSLPWLSHVA